MPGSLMLVLCAICLFFACSERPNTSHDISPPVASPTRQSETQQNLALQKEIEGLAAANRGRLGVSAVVLETGESVSLNALEHFPMQSVYKLPISMAVMQQVDQGKMRLDQKITISKEHFIGRRAHSPIRDKYPAGAVLSVEDLIAYAISESDGTASDVLMELVGGPDAIQNYLTSLAISDMKIVDTEKTFSKDPTAQHRNWSTPLAATALLRALHERRGLSESSQLMLLKYMIGSTPGKNRLKGKLPPGTVVAHKTGTSGTENGVTAATNDIGIITLPNGNHLAMAVFFADSPADERTREGVIAEAAKAVFDSWGNATKGG